MEEQKLSEKDLKYVTTGRESNQMSRTMMKVVVLFLLLVVVPVELLLDFPATVIVAAVVGIGVLVWSYRYTHQRDQQQKLDARRLFQSLKDGKCVFEEGK